MNAYIVMNMYLRNKTSVPMFYHGHKIWVLVLVRVIKSIVCFHTLPFVMLIFVIVLQYCYVNKEINIQYEYVVMYVYCINSFIFVGN